MKQFFSIIALITVLTTCSAANIANREDAMRQLLFDLLQTAQAETSTSTWPWTTPSPFNPLIPRKNLVTTDNAGKLSQNTFVRMIQHLSQGEMHPFTKDFNQGSDHDHESREQLLFPQILNRMVQTALQEERSSIQQRIFTPSNFVSPVVHRYLGPTKGKTQADVPRDGFKTLIFQQCLSNFTKYFSDLIPQAFPRDFGGENSDLSNSVINFVGSIFNFFNDFAGNDDTFFGTNSIQSDLIVPLLRLLGNINGGSSREELVARSQLDLKSIAGLITNRLGGSLPSLLNSKWWNLASILLNPDDASSVNRSLSSLFDSIDRSSLDTEVKDLLKRTIINAVPVLVKTLKGQEASKDEKLTLIDSVIRLLIHRYNFGKERTDALVPLVLEQFDRFFTIGHVDKELKPELISLMVQLLQKVGEDLLNLPSSDVEQAGLRTCVAAFQDAIRTNFSDFPYLDQPESSLRAGVEEFKGRYGTELAEAMTRRVTVIRPQGAYFYQRKKKN